MLSEESLCSPIERLVWAQVAHSKSQRCSGVGEQHRSWGTFTELSTCKILWADSQIIPDNGFSYIDLSKGNAPMLLFWGKCPSLECSGLQQCCLFGYCHACTSPWSFLPGICMHIKHLPVMATGLTPVTACPQALKWLKMRGLLARELDESVSRAPSLPMLLWSFSRVSYVLSSFSHSPVNI